MLEIYSHFRFLAEGEAIFFQQMAVQFWPPLCISASMWKYDYIDEVLKNRYISWKKLSRWKNQVFCLDILTYISFKMKIFHTSIFLCNRCSVLSPHLEEFVYIHVICFIILIMTLWWSWSVTQQNFVFFCCCNALLSYINNIGMTPTVGIWIKAEKTKALKMSLINDTILLLTLMEET